MGRPKTKVELTVGAVMEVYLGLREKEYHGFILVTLPTIVQYITRLNPDSVKEGGRVSEDFAERIAQTEAGIEELARTGLIEKVPVASGFHKDGKVERINGIVIRIVRPELSDDEIAQTIQDNLGVDFYTLVARMQDEIAELKRRLGMLP